MPKMPKMPKMRKIENMKIRKIFTIGFILMLISLGSYSQDKRTIETKVADLLAQLPANDTKYTDKLMNDMTALGEDGIKMICGQIIPAGTGDDTRARFAVESLSRFLSQKGKETEKATWEKICIEYATGRKNNGVKDFFIKQLQLIGGNATITALKNYLSDKEMCDPALAAILSVKGKEAESALAESLKNKELPSAAAVLNALAEMKSQLAVNEYIEWTSNANPNTRSSALNALAQSNSPLAASVLLKAAKDVFYRWEPSGATAALLNYAKNAGQSGDMKTMDKICKLVIAKCNDKLSIQNKTEALKIYAGFHGVAAMKELIKAAGHPDKTYRNAAFQVSLGIQGNDIVTKWIGYFPKAIPEAKPEIIAMLGNFKNEAALPLITSSLSGTDKAVRSEAAAALAKISGSKAVPPLIEYLKKSTDQFDQDAAKSALMSVSGNKEIDLLKSVLKDGGPAAIKSVIELMAWNKRPENLAQVIPYTSSDDEIVRSAAFKALADLAGPEDQTKLIDLMSAATDKIYISDIQTALASAAGKITDIENRSAAVLKAMETTTAREKFIPVLAKTGGREGLKTVLDEFENGNPAMRDICFKALTGWKDYTASSALYEICASGNKTFEEPAFKGYVEQIRAADLPDERKLLLYRKIMPYALSAERKNEILAEAGKLKTYQSLFFVANYLDDPSTSAAAADAAMFIALPSAASKAGMYGTLVRDILTKSIGKLAGPESEYNREMVNKYLLTMVPDEGFKPMFNGKDLTGWQGLVENPIVRSKMRKVDLERKLAEASALVPANWSVKDGCIWFNGKGNNLCTVVQYGDFEMFVDWKISKDGDSGIYLRGSPQVQIWDTYRMEAGAQVGSGGLYNNQVNPSKPLKIADNPAGDWNTFRIIMVGEKVSVWLNGELVVDNVIMENYWDRKIPIFPKESIELQAHGTDLAFRDLYIREINEKDYNLTPEEKAEGFVSIFNGKNLDNWIGNKQSYVAEDGMIVIKPENGSGGNLYTEKEYADFVFRFEFQLTPAANNGLGIRAPLEGDAAYAGMELQILDNTADVYSKLQPYQYHGSVYGVIPAKRDYLNPVGEWNSEEVVVKGTRITVTLNGTVIVDGDIAGPRDNGTMDHNDHPGLKNKTGHIGFLGHGSVVKFKNIRIKESNFN
jgi:HEAT repeat protein